MVVLIAEFASSNSPDEVRTATGAESPVAAGSPAESAATVIPADSNSKLASEEADKGPSITNSSASSSSSHHPEDAAGASYEMRRTPPQNKGHYLYHLIYLHLDKIKNR